MAAAAVAIAAAVARKKNKGTTCPRTNVTILISQ